jgi:hypothetical protein
MRLVSLEVFGIPKKDFGFKEKIRKLEKLNAEKLRAQIASLAPVPTAQALSDDSIKIELLKTKTLPLVSWKEKQTYLS